MIFTNLSPHHLGIQRHLGVVPATNISLLCQTIAFLNGVTILGYPTTGFPNCS